MALLWPLLLALLCLDGDLAGVSRCGAVELAAGVSASKAGSNEEVFAGGLYAVAVFTVVMILPTCRLLYNAMSEGQRCHVGSLPPGLKKKSRPFVHNLMETAPHLDDTYDPVLLTVENNQTTIRPYVPEGEGSIAMMIHAGDLPGNDPISDGELVVAVNCAQFDDIAGSSSRRAIVHLNRYIEEQLGDPTMDPHPLALTMLQIKGDHHLCKDDSGVIRVFSQNQSCEGQGQTEPKDLDSVCEEAKAIAQIDESTYVRTGTGEHDRQGLQIALKSNGPGRKLIGVLAALGLMAGAIVPFYFVEKNPEGGALPVFGWSIFNLYAPQDPVAFFVVILFPFVIITVYLTLYRFLLKAFPKPTDNIQTKVIFVALTFLMCFFIPLRDFYLTKSIETSSQYRAMHLLTIITTWVSHILALLLFTNSMMSYMTEKFGWKFPMLLSPSNANLILAVETLIGSLLGFMEVVIDEHGNGGACKFNRIHYSVSRVFRCSGSNEYHNADGSAAPCPVANLRVTCPSRPDEIEEFENRDNYNWTDWVVAAQKGRGWVYNQEAANASLESTSSSSSALLQTRARTTEFAAPAWITRLFGYEGVWDENWNDRFVGIDDGLHCLVQCAAYNSSSPGAPAWGEPQITQCGYQGVTGFDWVLQYHPNNFHHLCPGYGPKGTDANNRDLDYSYLTE